MPTGYTADVVDGKLTDFKQFVMTCARAFGACIEMRDDSMDKPIPEEFTPNTYFKKELEEARKRLIDLKHMTFKQLSDATISSYLKALEDYNTRKARYLEEQARLDAMQREVEAWTPPSKDHKELKNFMLEQLKISKIPIDYLKAPKLLSVSAWVREQTESLTRDINYYSNEWKNEQRRARERTNWIQQLRESLQ
jgi:hypothetical protein